MKKRIKKKIKKKIKNNSIYPTTHFGILPTVRSYFLFDYFIDKHFVNTVIII